MWEMFHLQCCCMGIYRALTRADMLSCSSVTVDTQFHSTRVDVGCLVAQFNYLCLCQQCHMLQNSTIHVYNIQMPHILCYIQFYHKIRISKNVIKFCLILYVSNKNALHCSIEYVGRNVLSFLLLL